MCAELTKRGVELLKGIRLFENLGTELTELETTGVIKGTGVTHLRLRVVRAYFIKVDHITVSTRVL
jgi:hypothetical protein